MPREVLLLHTAGPEVVAALEARTDIRLSVITEAVYTSQYRATTSVWTVPDVNDLGAVRGAALDIVRERPPVGVVVPSERALPTGGYLRTCLALPGTGFDVATAFSDKYVMKRRLSAAGVPVAPFRFATRAADIPVAAAELGWPVVVKPLRGSGSVGVARLDSDADPVRPSGPALVESFVPMSGEYHCDGVVHDGETLFASVSRYFAPLLGRRRDRAGSVAVSPDDPDHGPIVDLHRRAVRALGLRAGVTHLEVYRTDAGFVVGEITCRPGGSGIVDHVAEHHGVDLWDALLRTSLGDEPVLAPRPVSGVPAYLRLPLRRGLITYITPAEELERLPGVTRVELRCKAGDVAASGHPSPSAGLVFLRGHDYDDVLDAVERVAERFELRVEPIGTEDRRG
jgi:hypothetical protein